MRRTVLGGKPVGEIENHAGKESCFGRAQQKPHEIERARTRDQAPCAPASTPHVIMIRAIHRRAPNFSSSRLLGTSNRKYDTKKMPPPNPNTVAREMQVLDHLERGESQVDAVEKGDEIADHQERHDAQRHPAHRPGFERIRWVLTRISASDSTIPFAAACDDVRRARSEHENTAICMPPHACDAHCHVFGPAATFPYAPDRAYTPPDAPKQSLAALHAVLGIERAVIVQASCHGTDNRAMLDAIATSGGRYRGVAIVDASFTEHGLRRSARRRHQGRPLQLRQAPRRHAGHGRVPPRHSSASGRSAGIWSCTWTPRTSSSCRRAPARPSGALRDRSHGPRQGGRRPGAARRSARCST